MTTIGNWALYVKPERYYGGSWGAQHAPTEEKKTCATCRHNSGINDYDHCPYALDSSCDVHMPKWAPLVENQRGRCAGIEPNNPLGKPCQIIGDNPHKKHPYKKYPCRECRFGDPTEHPYHDLSTHCRCNHRDQWEKCTYMDRISFVPRYNKHERAQAKLKARQAKQSLRLDQKEATRHTKSVAKAAKQCAKVEAKEAKRKAKEDKQKVVERLEQMRVCFNKQSIDMTKLRQQLSAQAERIATQAQSIDVHSDNITRQIKLMDDQRHLIEKLNKPLNFDVEFAKWEMKKTGVVVAEEPKSTPKATVYTDAALRLAD